MSNPHNVKLDRDTDALQQLALDMGRLAEAILEKSLHSVWELDAKLAAKVKQDDLSIDRLDLAIDDRDAKYGNNNLSSDISKSWHSNINDGGTNNTNA